jgi:hypothetical protein
MRSRPQHQGRQARNEIERLEHDRRRAIAPAAAQRVDDAATVIERQPFGLEGGPGHIATQAFESIAVVSRDADFGMQREIVDVTAQLAWDEAGGRAIVTLATTPVLDRLATFGPERGATLHRGRAQFCERD